MPSGHLRVSTSDSPLVNLKRFGAVDVARRKYEQLLEQALEGSARFYP